jgi:putative endonuclease
MTKEIQMSSSRTRGSRVLKELDSLFQGNDKTKNKMLMSKTYYVYILASKRNGTLYIGVTSDLIKRIYEHKNNLVDGFTKLYSIHTLVYFEQTNDIKSAITREKQLKKWNRKWKLGLIEKGNPQWNDLYNGLI